MQVCGPTGGAEGVEGLKAEEVSRGRGRGEFISREESRAVVLLFRGGDGPPHLREGGWWKTSGMVDCGAWGAPCSSKRRGV